MFTALLKHAYGTAEMNAISMECVSQVAFEIGLEFDTLYEVEDSGEFVNTYAAQKLQAMLAGNEVRKQRREGTGKFAGKSVTQKPAAMDEVKPIEPGPIEPVAPKDEENVKLDQPEVVKVEEAPASSVSPADDGNSGTDVQNVSEEPSSAS